MPLSGWSAIRPFDESSPRKATESGRELSNGRVAGNTTRTHKIGSGQLRLILRPSGTHLLHYVPSRWRPEQLHNLQRDRVIAGLLFWQQHRKTPFILGPAHLVFVA